MIPLRERTPIRRTVPTKKPTVSWGKHKGDLKQDFNNHCGYCDSFDGFSHTYFEVDHFVPKDLILKNGWPISLVEYSNLVYSCKFCNNNKLANWPSGSYTIHRIRNKGFVDPCNKKYDNNFYRRKNGEIMWKSALGKWMYFHAFKFDQRIPGIKLLWNLNRIRKAILILKVEQKKHIPTSKKFKQIQAEITSLYGRYFPVHQQLMEYHRNL